MLAERFYKAHATKVGGLNEDKALKGREGPRHRSDQFSNCGLNFAALALRARG